MTMTRKRISCEELRAKLVDCAELSRIFGDANKNSPTYMSYLEMVKDSKENKNNLEVLK